MRITEIKLEGYIGIKNGLGLDSLYIDTRKCVNSILMIIGDNGVGKSTLWNAWHFFPDPNDCFVPGMPASKKLTIDDEYEVIINHGVKVNGDRDTPKIYLYKDIDGERVNLNPNLNVNSYKDIILSEFGLDANFIVLSQLAQNSRGLADMRPADRKKFINSIISDLTDYNDMYKVLSKRSSVYKSFINNTSSKISALGDKEYLTNSLINIETRLNRLMNEKEETLELLAKHKSLIQINDPDGNIQQTYNTLCSTIINITDKRSSIAKSITDFCRTHGIDTNGIQKFYTDLKDRINNQDTQLQLLMGENSNLLVNRENSSREVQKLKADLDSITSNFNIDELEMQLNKLLEEKAGMDRFISSNNITDKGFTLDQLITLNDIVTNIASQINNICSSYNISVLQQVNSDVNPNIDVEIKHLEERLSVIGNEITRYNTLLQVTEVLTKRPDKCNIDTCPFIINAVNAINQQPQENIALLEAEKKSIDLKLQELYAYKVKSIDILKCNNDINILLRTVQNYQILSKVNINITREVLIDYINRQYRMENELNLINNLTEECNVLIHYNSICTKLEKVQNDYKYLESKKEMISFITKNISDITGEINNIEANISSNNAKINELRQVISVNNDIYKQTEYILTNKQEYDKLESQVSDINSRIYTLQSTMKNIQMNINKVQEYTTKLDSIDREISPMIEDRDTFKHSLRLLEEYLAEFERYKDKYAKIELIKKYTSPTTGVGLIFMELYMNSTLNIVNDLMNLVFDGEFFIPKFEINEKEFRIPCMGNALMNDDISSMSGGQIAIISMILSFSILHQSATRYNIFKLDEIDAPLDATNRRIFVEVLYKMINILRLDQVVMISHNQEIPMANVDLIVLKTSEDITEGNVIYRY